MTDLHVVPKDDDVMHEMDEACPCGPTVEVQPNGDIWVHHSLDGREAQ